MMPIAHLGVCEIVSILSKDVARTLEKRSALDPAAAIAANVLSCMSMYGELGRLDLWENAFIAVSVVFRTGRQHTVPNPKSQAFQIMEAIFSFACFNSCTQFNPQTTLAAYEKLTDLLAGEHLPYLDVSDIPDW